MRTVRRLQQGLSLVELMVALLIGVILTSGVISVYITSKSSYSMNAGLGQVQEAGRFAMQSLQPIMVMAGSTGCAHVTTVASTVNSADEVYNFNDAVYGFEFTGTGTGGYMNDSSGAASNSPTLDNNASDWSPALSSSPLAQAALNNLAVKYSDVLMVHEMLGTNAPILGTSSKSSIVYDTTYAPTLSAGEILMASNCSKSASLFQAGTVGGGAIATNGSGTPGTSGVLATDYSSSVGGAWVAPAQTYIFFVGKGLDKGTSLYEVKLEPDNSNGKAGQLGTPVEIVPGVENMQVLYGVDNGGMQYVTADNVPSWASVISVRIALLVHSDANSVDKAPISTTAVHMLGTGFSDSFSYRPYADRRMRRYFAETFSIRNSVQ